MAGNKECNTKFGEIMRNKNKLAGTRIYIDHKLTWRERKFLIEIREKARKTKEIDKECAVKIRYKKLYVVFEFRRHKYKWTERTDTMELARTAEYEDQVEGRSSKSTENGGLEEYTEKEQATRRYKQELWMKSMSVYGT